MSESLEPGPTEPLIGWDLGKLREVRPREMAIRFGFGAAVSVVAALISAGFGAHVGGMFLAFPAILPATLTLLEQKHGTQPAVHDQRGALLGAVGLVGFAVTAAIGFTRWPRGVVLLAAGAVWLLVAVSIYLAVASWRRAHR